LAAQALLGALTAFLFVMKGDEIELGHFLDQRLKRRLLIHDASSVGGCWSRRRIAGSKATPRADVMEVIAARGVTRMIGVFML
jgi:hypothetical protein